MERCVRTAATASSPRLSIVVRASDVDTDSNPLLGDYMGHTAVGLAKKTIDAFMHAMILELAHERQTLAEYLASYDIDGTGSIPVYVAATMFVKVAEKWTQRTPFSRPVVVRALKSLSMLDETPCPDGEISVRHLFYACTTQHRTRRVLAASVMHQARTSHSPLALLRNLRRSLLSRMGLGSESSEDVLSVKTLGRRRRFGSLEDETESRGHFLRFLKTAVPSLQPHELTMCWEVHHMNKSRMDRGEHERAPTSDNISFILKQISVSASFRCALTLCIVLNAVSMMLDDPLCDPVDSSGSHQCIFNCVKVESTIVGHTCDAQLEITRQQLEFLLLVVFTLELGLLLFTMRYRYFADGWNQIDFVVISLSWVSLFVDGPSVAVVRLVKLLRMLRAFKGYKKMQVILGCLLHFACAGALKGFRPPRYREARVMCAFCFLF